MSVRRELRRIGARALIAAARAQRAGVLACALAAAAPACGGTTTTVAPARPDDRAAASPGDQLAARVEPALVALAACTVDALGIAAGCAANDAWETLWYATVEGQRDRAVVAEVADRLGKRHLADRAAAVRVQAASLLAESGAAGSGEALATAIVDENDAAARRAMVSETVSAVPLVAAATDRAGLGPLLVDLARDHDPEVRLLASGWLTSPPFAVAGAADAVIEMMRNDPDVTIRGEVCQSAAGLGRDEVVAAMAAVTARPDDAPGDMYERCMSGLIEAWATPWYPINEKAYRLTLDRLRATPRSQRSPPADAIGFLLLLGTEHEQLDAWRAKATWFSAPDLIEILAAIAADARAALPARTSAIEVARVIGAPAARLKKLKKALGRKADAALVEAVDAAIAAAHP